MNYFAEMLGRVMMTAVNLPRSDNDKDKYNSMRVFAETEFRKSDQAYVLDCLLHDRKIDVV